MAEPMKAYFEEKGRISKSIISPCDKYECDGACCRNKFQVEVTVFDLIDLGRATGHTPRDVFDKYCNIAPNAHDTDRMGDNVDEIEPVVSLKMPCALRNGGKCDVYSERPFVCMGFPEVFLLPESCTMPVNVSEYPCLMSQKPFDIDAVREARRAYDIDRISQSVFIQPFGARVRRFANVMVDALPGSIQVFLSPLYPKEDYDRFVCELWEHNKSSDPGSETDVAALNAIFEERYGKVFREKISDLSDDGGKSKLIGIRNHVLDFCDRSGLL